MADTDNFQGENELLKSKMKRILELPLWQLMMKERGILGVVILFLAALFSLSRIGKDNLRKSRKAQQARRMRETYRTLEKQSNDNEVGEVPTEGSFMQISQLWVYPIKSLRGCPIPAAMLTKEGFYLDRRFMLLKDHGTTPRKLENMHISNFSNMCLFHPSISGDKLTIQYRPPGTSQMEADTLEISLEPEEFLTLEKVDIDMHGSPTTGYDMGSICNAWFSERFGFKVLLIFWGDNGRTVLGNLPGRPADQGPGPRNAITRVASSFPLFSALVEEENETIAFNDCAPYLVISDSSVADVTARLPPDVEMDLTKFRANIVLKGHTSAYEEDFWGELFFERNGAKIILTGNCGRCQSLNVDYLSGKSRAGKDGKVLQLLQKDRRVDPGMKYSPIFGRYGFVANGDEGLVLRVGDKVVVSRKNEERTRFYWPGLST